MPLSRHTPRVLAQAGRRVGVLHLQPAGWRHRPHSDRGVVVIPVGADQPNPAAPMVWLFEIREAVRRAVRASMTAEGIHNAITTMDRPSCRMLSAGLLAT